MTAAETLRAAKALIDTPDKWTKGAIAGNQNLGAVSPWSSSATRFCIMGAAFCAIDGSDYKAIKVLHRTAQSKGFRSAADFNDHSDTTHADVMAFFDRAIELAESEAA